MAKDFESIATATGDGTSQTIVFSSISNSYTHLQLRGVVRTARASATVDGVFMYFNSDSTDTNYISHVLDGDSSGVSSSGAYNNGVYARIALAPAANSTANLIGTFVCDILDYKNTNKFKVSRSFCGANQLTSSSQNVRLVSGLWRSTSAINSITIWNNNNSAFTTLTHIALYGLKG